MIETLSTVLVALGLQINLRNFLKIFGGTFFLGLMDYTLVLLVIDKKKDNQEIAK